MKNDCWWFQIVVAFQDTWCDQRGDTRDDARGKSGGGSVSDVFVVAKNRENQVLKGRRGQRISAGNIREGSRGGGGGGSYKFRKLPVIINVIQAGVEDNDMFL